MTQVNNALTLFFSLLVEAIPFLLLGVLFSSALLLFVDERKLVALMPRHPLLAAFAGSLIGFLFPVCECGNVPVARRLIMQGAPASLAIGFLLAAPTVNPIVFWATWTAFRDQPEIVFLRVGVTLVIASLVGWIFSAQADLRPLLQPSVSRLMAEPSPRRRSLRQGRRSGASAGDTTSRESSDIADSPLLQSGTFLLGAGGQAVRLDGNPLQAAVANPTLSRPFTERLWLMLENVVLELRELGGVLVMGTAIAAIIQVMVPREVVLSLGQGYVSSILAMMVLACVVSICSTVDSFFALSFASTFTSGSLLAFLVFGPMIDLKNMALLWSVFRARAIIYLFVLAGQLTFLFALLMNLYVS